MFLQSDARTASTPLQYSTISRRKGEGSLPEQNTGNLTNAEKFHEIFGKDFFWLLFKVSYSSLMKWAGSPYLAPGKVDADD